MKTLRFAMSLAFIAGLTVINANAQTAEETLAKIEKDFAAAQITKNPKAFEAIAAVMSDDFCSFDPTSGVRLTKKELIATSNPRNTSPAKWNSLRFLSGSLVPLPWCKEPITNWAA
jgi:hypothetical protein